MGGAVCAGIAPAIFAAALVTALAPPILFDASWTGWAYRALVLLVIGCPCALVISAPVTIVAALTSAARNGILIKADDLRKILWLIEHSRRATAIIRQNIPLSLAVKVSLC